MNDETVKIFIQNLPSILTAAGVILTAYWSYRSNMQSKSNAVEIARSNQQSEANAVKIDANAEQLAEVRKDVNGKMEKLLEVSNKASFREGVLQEKGDQQAAQHEVPLKVSIVESPVSVTIEDKPVPVTMVDEDSKS